MTELDPLTAAMMMHQVQYHRANRLQAHVDALLAELDQQVRTAREILVDLETDDDTDTMPSYWRGRLDGLRKARALAVPA